MSHIAKIELEINDLESLKAACEALGFNFMANQTTYRWFGRWVGDTPLPEGVSIEELGKCTHAIHVPAAVFEVGVVQKGIHGGSGWVAPRCTVHRVYGPQRGASQPAKLPNHHQLVLVAA